MNAVHRQHLVVFLLLLLSVRISIGAPATSTSPTNAPKEWPRLVDVLEKWDAVAWTEVERSANAGELTAQHYLGYCYSEGHRVAADPTQGIAWYSKAGDGGYLPSLSNLGYLYQRGKGVPRDFAKMLSYYRRAADAGYVPALRFVGNTYRDGRGVPVDYPEAMKWFRRAANQGDLTAMTEIGRLYRFGYGVAKDQDEALRWFRRAADRQDTLAELNLGLFYEDEGNPVEAIRYYREAADAGLANAMLKLYWCYRNGAGVAADSEQASSWLEKAAEAGSPNAQTELGYRYQHPATLNEVQSRFLLKKLTEAVKWYTRAAEQDFPHGEYYLAQCYLDGDGVEKDEERGLDLMRRAADQNLLRAVRDLALLYAQGVGEPRDASDTPLRLWQRLLTLKDPDDELWFSRESATYNQIVFRFLAGLGTDQDWVAAADWYCRAALDNVEGYSLDVGPRFSLHTAFARFSGPSDVDGSIVGQDRPDVDRFSKPFLPVLRLYLDAAASKPAAMRSIAEMYSVGRNAPVDPQKAWVWFTLSGEHGNATAHARSTELEHRLNAEDLKHARELLAATRNDLSKVAAASSSHQP